MTPDPLHAMPILLACENVEADFRPVVETLRDLKRFMLLMVCRVDALDDRLLSLRREIRVKLHHCRLRSNCIGCVNLNLVVALSEPRNRTH